MINHQLVRQLLLEINIRLIETIIFLDISLLRYGQESQRINPPISKFEICQYISRYIFKIYINTHIGYQFIVNKSFACLSIHLPYQFSLDLCPYIPSFCFMDKGTG